MACGAPSSDTVQPGSATEKLKTPDIVVNKVDQNTSLKSTATTLVAYQHALALHLSRKNLAKIYVAAGSKVLAKKELDELARLGEKSATYTEVMAMLTAL